MPHATVDEFDDEIIFPTGYEENYEYREDIIKPNQAVDPRREIRDSSSNNQDQHEPFEFHQSSHQRLVVTPKHFDSSQSQYGGLVESHL